MRSLLVIVATALVSAFPQVAGAVAWTKEAITYTPPEGFLPEVGGPADRITWSRRDGDRSCSITILWSHATGGDVMADHQRTWAAIAEAGFHTGAAAQPMRQALPNGVEVLGSIGAGQALGGGGPVIVVVMTAHALDRSVPIIILAPTAAALQAYQPAIEAFTVSLIVHKPYERPANLPSQPLRVTLADLAGDWQQGGANVITYVNSSGGIAGSSSSFYNQVRHVDADGSYRASTAGMTGGATVREEVTGRMSLDGEILTVTQAGHSTIRRRLVLFHDGPNGTLMGLVEPERPVDLGNITANGEYWVRRRR